MSQPCDCNEEFQHSHVSIEVTGIPGHPSCCTHCPPESFVVSYGDGTQRQMTDEEREAFLAWMATPFN